MRDDSNLSSLSSSFKLSFSQKALLTIWLLYFLFTDSATNGNLLSTIFYFTVYGEKYDGAQSTLESVAVNVGMGLGSVTLMGAIGQKLLRKLDDQPIKIKERENSAVMPHSGSRTVLGHSSNQNQGVISSLSFHPSQNQEDHKHHHSRCEQLMELTAVGLPYGALAAAEMTSIFNKNIMGYVISGASGVSAALNYFFLHQDHMESKKSTMDLLNKLGSSYEKAKAIIMGLLNVAGHLFIAYGSARECNAQFFSEDSTLVDVGWGIAALLVIGMTAVESRSEFRSLIVEMTKAKESSEIEDKPKKSNCVLRLSYLGGISHSFGIMIGLINLMLDSGRSQFNYYERVIPIVLGAILTYPGMKSYAALIEKDASQFFNRKNPLFSSRCLTVSEDQQPLVELQADNDDSSKCCFSLC